MIISRPMKPYKLVDSELAGLHYPLYGTPKIDGIRCTKVAGHALSASHKPIANSYIRSLIENSTIPDGFDGELVVPGTFQDTVHAVMSQDGNPPFVWRVFDHIRTNFSVHYIARCEDLRLWFISNRCDFCEPVLPDIIRDETDLLKFEDAALEEGYEGVVLRNPGSPYKNGRGTLRAQDMLALKRFTDAEAEVIGMTEMMHNDNEATMNELGLAHRSSHQDNKVGLNMMGALVVRNCTTGVEFAVGTGFTVAERIDLFATAAQQVGRIVKYKSLPHGVKDKPRHPVFLGFRPKEDIAP